jgi:DNA gyrase/topoisomerase IV subunit B
VSSFVDYVALYATGEDTARVWERVNDRWEVCLTGADGTFGQVRQLYKEKSVLLGERTARDRYALLASVLIPLSLHSLISPTPFHQVSFVNSICTTKGGQHVNYIADQIAEAV